MARLNAFQEAKKLYSRATTFDQKGLLRQDPTTGRKSVVLSGAPAQAIRTQQAKTTQRLNQLQQVPFLSPFISQPRQLVNSSSKFITSKDLVLSKQGLSQYGNVMKAGAGTFLTYYGGSKLAKAPIKNTAKNLAIGSGFGAGIGAALSGKGKRLEGAKQGATSYLNWAPTFGATSPAIMGASNIAASKFAPTALKGNLLGRAVSGLGNTLEGFQLNQQIGRPVGQGAGIDFASGFLFGSPSAPNAKGVQEGILKRDDINEIGNMFQRATGKWFKNGKIDMDQYMKDENVVNLILKDKYGASAEELKRPLADKVKQLYQIAMEDRQANLGVRMGITGQDNVMSDSLTNTKAQDITNFEPNTKVAKEIQNILSNDTQKKIGLSAEQEAKQNFTSIQNLVNEQSPVLRNRGLGSYTNMPELDNRLISGDGASGKASGLEPKSSSIYTDKGQKIQAPSNQEMRPQDLEATGYTTDGLQRKIQSENKTNPKNPSYASGVGDGASGKKLQGYDIEGLQYKTKQGTEEYGGLMRPLNQDTEAKSYTNHQLAKNPEQAVSVRNNAQQGASQSLPSEKIISQDPKIQNYFDSLVASQKSAKKGAELSTIAKIKDTLRKFKTGLVDEQSAIEDALSNAEKKGKFKIRPEYDIRVNGIDRVLRSKSLASQFAKDNGMMEVIKKAPNLDALNQYLIAKHAIDVAGKGIETGRNLSKDNELLRALAPQYEEMALSVNQYSRKLLDYSVDSGLISKDLAKGLVETYPNYVPLQRVFSELEKESLARGVGTRPVASLSKQSIVQKLKGSEREITNPIESLLLKTNDAFNQGERNKTAKMLASYKDLPGFEGLIKEAPEGAKHTFSYLENGVKKTFETTPEIEAAAKNLDQEQMGLLVKIFNAPTRMLQLGATGLNIPFIGTNIVKDELTGFINSNKGMRTSLVNPSNFVRSLFSALKHDDLYDEVVRNAGMNTTYDISREAADLSIKKIRSERSAASSVLYKVTNPSELLRSLENTVGRAEEFGRIKNYRGMKEALIREGRTAKDASILAAQAGRENTANFARKGTWGRTLNYIIPFFNAGIQGARQLNRSFQNSPKGTAVKMASTVFMPVAVATAWNLADPQRKQVYDDISKFEKENNLIIIPPNPQQDEKGRWIVRKIPIPPGISNLAAMIRRPIEASQGLDPLKFREIATNLTAAGTSIDTSSPTKLLSSVTPQALKVPLEAMLNKNFFTGRDIVPQYMQDKLPEDQVYSDTSGTARLIGRTLNSSPLKVDNSIRTALGGLGSQLQNASDKTLNKAGVIPKEQIGGEGIAENIVRRTGRAYGGEIKRRDEKTQGEYSKARKDAMRAFLQGDVDKAKELKSQYKFEVTKGEIKTEKTNQMSKAADLFLEGDLEGARKIKEDYKLEVTNKYVKSRAKSRSIELFKKYKATGNDDYLNEAKQLKEKYKFDVLNKEITY